MSNFLRYQKFRGKKVKNYIELIYDVNIFSCFNWGIWTLTDTWWINVGF